jgi:hypothetical protein
VAHCLSSDAAAAKRSPDATPVLGGCAAAGSTEDEPAMVLPPLTYPGNVLAPYAKAININDRIMDAYLGEVLPGGWVGVGVGGWVCVWGGGGVAQPAAAVVTGHQEQQQQQQQQQWVAALNGVGCPLCSRCGLQCSSAVRPAPAPQGSKQTCCR